jgi:hypothetical protein
MPINIAMVQITIPANKPLVLAINTGAEADTFRVKLLSIAQHVHAKAMADKPNNEEPLSFVSG